MDSHEWPQYGTHQQQVNQYGDCATIASPLCVIRRQAQSSFHTHYSAFDHSQSPMFFPFGRAI